jgi:hypothetical protein
MAEPKTSLSVDENGVALILLDYKPLNALHPQRKLLALVDSPELLVPFPASNPSLHTTLPCSSALPL